MEVGAAFTSTALPPLKVNAKSLFSSDPLPLEALNTGSDMVTEIVALLAATEMLCTVAGVLSFNVAELFVWFVLEILSSAS